MNREQKIALKHFSDAASEYPASVTAQAAFLCLLAKQNPTLLNDFQELISHEDGLISIKNIAEHFHQKSQNPRVSSPLDEVDIAKVVDTIYRRTKQYEVLEAEQLKEILNRYPQPINDANEMLYQAETYTKYLFRKGR